MPTDDLSRCSAHYHGDGSRTIISCPPADPQTNQKAEVDRDFMNGYLRDVHTYNQLKEQGQKPPPVPLCTQCAAAKTHWYDGMRLPTEGEAGLAVLASMVGALLGLRLRRRRAIARLAAARRNQKTIPMGLRT